MFLTLLNCFYASGIIISLLGLFFKISCIISAKAFAVFTWELDVAKLSV